MMALKQIQMIGAPLFLVPIGEGGFNGGWQPKQYTAGGATYDTAVYKVQSGDNLQALAQRYMGAASRYKEIWAYQSADYQSSRNNDPNYLKVGDTLKMPQDAIDGAAALGFVPMSLQVFDPAPGIGPAYKPAGGGTAPKPPGTDPQPPPPKPPSSTGLPKAAMWGIGLGAVGLVAGGVAWHTWGKKKRAA